MAGVRDVILSAREALESGEPIPEEHAWLLYVAEEVAKLEPQTASLADVYRATLRGMAAGAKTRRCVVMSTNRTGAERIAKERRRQTEKLGWTDEHDDGHTGGDLAIAAACYAAQAGGRRIYIRRDHAAGVRFDDPWPWETGEDARHYPDRGNVVGENWKNRSHQLRLLEKAGALIAAEIDRLLRAEKTRGGA